MYGNTYFIPQQSGRFYKQPSSVIICLRPNEFTTQLQNKKELLKQKLFPLYVPAAQEALENPLLSEPSSPLSEAGGEADNDPGEKSALSSECGLCIGAVGQAVWNCGTLEMECIKNTLELKSDCYG